MLDFSHVLDTPGYDIQKFIGHSSATASTGAGGQQWQTWRKPRGAKFVYMVVLQEVQEQILQQHQAVAVVEDQEHNQHY
jgi:hypothetical protein